MFLKTHGALNRINHRYQIESVKLLYFQINFLRITYFVIKPINSSNILHRMLNVGQSMTSFDHSNFRYISYPCGLKACSQQSTRNQVTSLSVNV